MCCSDNDDIPLQCSAGDISIKNVTFEQENDNNGIVLIKSGRVTFDNCEMKCVTNGVIVETDGEMVMRECKLHGAKVTISVLNRILYSHCGGSYRRITNIHLLYIHWSKPFDSHNTYL